MTIATPVAAAMGTPDINSRQSVPVVPFRRATLERVDILPSQSGSITTSAQRVETTVEGSGYLYGIWLRFASTGSNGGSANVANQEDAPWTAFDTVVLRDVNGELINLAGYDLYLANLINRQYGVRFTDQSTRSYLQSAPTTGTGATAGTFTFALRVPVGINRRDLIGILGNQDRAQKYALRLDIGASGAIWSTAPSALATYNIDRLYENYAVPMPASAQGQPQEVFPPSFGTLHFITSTLSEAAPAGGATVSHYLRRIGNTVRWIALVFRINGTRSSVETVANNPTNIRFKIGEDTIFNETWSYRKALMYERFGFDMPDGVLVYDALHDFSSLAGFELGDDYYHTQAVINAMFQIAYPSGFGSTNNTLRIITDDLQRVGSPIR